VAVRGGIELFATARRRGHGWRDQPIVAERHWPTAQPAGGFADTLRIEVSNITQGGQGDAAGSPAGGTGRGLDGMRRRLESIGSHLDVRRERVAQRANPVRVIVLTTFNLDDRAATAIRHGASGFLLKDTTPPHVARPGGHRGRRHELPANQHVHRHHVPTTSTAAL
jgi:hypothetical protein